MASPEPELRAALVRYAQALWSRRLTAGTSGNLSLLLDDGDLLVTPAGASLGALTPEGIVRTDPAGKPRSAQHASSEVPLHVAAYRARTEIRAVVHAHPTYATVWSTSGGLFPRLTVGARESLGPIAWAPYQPAGSPALAATCAAAFARGNDVVLMERHGVTTVATTLERAFALADQAEDAARVAYFARLAGFTGDAP